METGEQNRLWILDRGQNIRLTTESWLKVGFQTKAGSAYSSVMKAHKQNA